MLLLAGKEKLAPLLARNDFFHKTNYYKATSSFLKSPNASVTAEKLDSTPTATELIWQLGWPPGKCIIYLGTLEMEQFKMS